MKPYRTPAGNMILTPTLILTLTPTRTLTLTLTITLPLLRYGVPFTAGRGATAVIRTDRFAGVAQGGL